MTSATRGQRKIEYNSDIQKSKDKIFEYFKQASFTDCKINAFPYNTEHTAVDLQVKNRTAASFIMIDLDVKDFSDKEKLDKQLKKTLKILPLKFTEESYPTVLWSGNGYHIYQPIEGFVFEEHEIFYKFLSYVDSKNLTTEFLRFAEKFFTNGKADLNHRPSIKSCLVRVPGTINSKNGQQVQVIQRWDGKRPAVQWITSDFRDHLIQKRNDKIEENKMRRKNKVSINSQGDRHNNKIDWIERLLQTPIEDGRKQCLWRILCPYIINIRKVAEQEAFIMLDEWLKKCGELRPLDFQPNKIIEDDLKNVKQFLPPSKDKLKDQYKEIYNILKAKNIFID
jgi:hypothetical protein